MSLADYFVYWTIILGFKILHVLTPNYLDLFKYVNEINTRSIRLMSYMYSYFVLVSDFYDYDKINEASLLCLVICHLQTKAEFIPFCTSCTTEYELYEWINELN